MSTVEVHKQITADEIAHTFEEEAPVTAHLGQYAFEDWVTLAIFSNLPRSVAINASASFRRPVACPNSRRLSKISSSDFGVSQRTCGFLGRRHRA